MKKASLAVALLILLSLSFIAPRFLIENASATVWGPEMEISIDSGTGGQENPSIAVDGSKVHVVWEERGTGDYDIYYRHFNGTSWQPEQEISSDIGSYSQYTPSIAVDAGEVHVVWRDENDMDPDIFYRHFNGTSWQPEQEISSDIGSENQYTPSIAVEDGKVHVAWVDREDGDLDIFYRYFNGTSWQPEEEISTDIGTESQWTPSIAVENGKIHIVWEDWEDGDYDIFYRHFNGTAWQSELEISSDSADELQTFSSIAVKDGNVHVVWQDHGDGSPDIHYRHFNGTDWEPELEISTDVGAEWQYDPSIAVDSGKVHVTWKDNLDGDWDIFYRHFDGTSWQPEEELSVDVGVEDQEWPSIAANGDNVHVVWENQEDGDTDIYYRLFNGTSWEPIEEISIELRDEEEVNPSIAIEGNEVHVVWEERRFGDRDIYYRRFDGLTWRPELEVSMDPTTGYQHDPAIAVYGNDVHVVWEDRRDFDPDIYYRRFDGTTWQPELEISTDMGTEWQRDPSIAVDGNNVHVVWADPGDGDFDIYHRYYDGTNWQPALDISTDATTEEQERPSVAAYNGEVHVVWEDRWDGDGDIYYRHFDGIAWTSEIEISTDALTEDQGNPSIACDGDRLHVAWIDAGDGDSDIYYKYFNGTEWQPELEISTDMGTENQYDPTIAADAGTVHIAWRDLGDGDWDIYYRYFNRTGWEPEEEVSTDIGANVLQFGPSIAAEGGYAHIAFADNWGTDNDILYRNGTYDVQDATPPESNVNPLSPYWLTAQTFAANWTATDDFDLADISLHYRFSSDNSSWSVWEIWANDSTISGTYAIGSFPFTAPYGEGYYEFYTVAEDAVGNQEIAPALADAVAGVDVSPPHTTLSIGIPSFGTLPVYVSPTTEFTLIGADNLSGVESISFGIDSEPMAPYTTPFNLSGYDGPHLMKFMSADNAGNNETVNEVLVHVDDTPPTSAIQFGQPAVVCWPTPMCISSSTQINISATDDAAGVESTWVQLDGDWFPYEGNFTIPTDGMHNIFYNSTDNVKNHERINTWGAFVDNTPPVADAGPDQDVPMGALVTFEGNQSFDLGGINNHTWSFFDGGNVTLYWRNPSHIFEVSGDFLVTLVVKDIMGYTDTDTMWVNVTVPPVTPKNLTVESGERGELKLTWDPVEDVVGYNLYRANISGGPYIQVNEEIITHPLFNDTGLPDATTFYYTVTAVDFLAEESPPSLEASGMTMAVGEDGILGEYWWVLLLLGSIIFVLIVLFMRRRKLEGENPPDDESPSPEPQRSETDDA